MPTYYTQTRRGVRVRPTIDDVFFFTTRLLSFFPFFSLASPSLARAALCTCGGHTAVLRYISLVRTTPRQKKRWGGRNRGGGWVLFFFSLSPLSAYSLSSSPRVHKNLVWRHSKNLNFAQGVPDEPTHDAELASPAFPRVLAGLGRGTSWSKSWLGWWGDRRDLKSLFRGSGWIRHSHNYM